MNAAMSASHDEPTPDDRREGSVATAAAPPEQSAAGGPSDFAVRAVAVSKTYGMNEDTRVDALTDVTVGFRRGHLTAIMGPSGSGKSTLMHCLAGLDAVTSGHVWIGDTEVSDLRDRGLTRLRRAQVGFIFQQYNLLPTLTAAENITLPMAIAGRRPDREWMDLIVGMLGLGDRLGHRPAQLSGGQQQRVACARALVPRPEVVFADEPTGNLDSRTGGEVLRFLQRSVREFGQTVVLVTHDPIAASYADRVVFLADGRLVDEMADPTADMVLRRMAPLDAEAAGDDAP
jgi:putative ABC transport system ATP-binding protein